MNSVTHGDAFASPTPVLPPAGRPQWSDCLPAYERAHITHVAVGLAGACWACPPGLPQFPGDALVSWTNRFGRTVTRSVCRSCYIGFVTWAIDEAGQATISWPAVVADPAEDHSASNYCSAQLVAASA